MKENGSREITAEETRTPHPAQVRAGGPRALRAPRLPEVREHRGRAVSGWAALAAATLNIAACVVLLALAGVRVLGAAAVLPDPQWPTTGFWIAAGFCALCASYALSGLTWGRDDTAVVLSLGSSYRGTVRRTGFLWLPPLLRRHPVDVRLRHWRSDEIRAVDRDGAAFGAVVLVVWRARDTARAVFGAENHEAYLGAVVEAAVCRVMSTSRNVDALADAPPSGDLGFLAEELTAAVAAECRAVGLDVYSVQPFHIAYAPDVAGALRSQQLFVLNAQLRQAVADNMVDTVTATVDRLVERNVVSLDEVQRSELVKDLSVAFYAARDSMPGRRREPPVRSSAGQFTDGPKNVDGRPGLSSDDQRNC